MESHMQNADGLDAFLNDPNKAAKVELSELYQASQRECKQLRHALDNEKFEQIKMQSTILQLREQIANQARELEKWIRTSFECNRELEKSSCMLAALCGDHEQNIYLNDQLTHSRIELNQLHQEIASLQDQLVGHRAELDLARNFRIEAEALREQLTIQTRALEQISAHNQDMQFVSVQNVELKQQLSASISEIDVLRARYEIILASNSWNVTRPFRVFRRFLSFCTQALLGKKR